MTDYINKQDAYRIALHDGGPVCAEKIAQLEPLKINLWPDITDPNIIRQLPTITIDIKPATLNPKTLSWGGVDLKELQRLSRQLDDLQKIDSIGAVFKVIEDMRISGKSDEEIQRFIDEETVFGSGL